MSLDHRVRVESAPFLVFQKRRANVCIKEIVTFSKIGSSSTTTKTRSPRASLGERLSSVHAVNVVRGVLVCAGTRKPATTKSRRVVAGLDLLELGRLGVAVGLAFVGVVESFLLFFLLPLLALAACHLVLHLAHKVGRLLGKFATLTDLRSELVEEERHGHTCQSEESGNGGCPVNTETVVHLGLRRCQHPFCFC